MGSVGVWERVEVWGISESKWDVQAVTLGFMDPVPPEGCAWAGTWIYPTREAALRGLRNRAHRKIQFLRERLERIEEDLDAEAARRVGVESIP